MESCRLRDPSHGLPTPMAKLAALSRTREAQPTADLPHTSVGTAAALQPSGRRSGDGLDPVVLEVSSLDTDTWGSFEDRAPVWPQLTALCFRDFPAGPCSHPSEQGAAAGAAAWWHHEGSPELRWRASSSGSLKDTQTLHCSQLWFREMVGKKNLWNTMAFQIGSWRASTSGATHTNTSNYSTGLRFLRYRKMVPSGKQAQTEEGHETKIKWNLN